MFKVSEGSANAALLKQGFILGFGLWSIEHRLNAKQLNIGQGVGELCKAFVHGCGSCVSKSVSSQNVANVWVYQPESD